MNNLEQIVAQVFQEEPVAVERAKSDTLLINYLTGKVLQKTKGQGNPTDILRLVREKIFSPTF